VRWLEPQALNSCRWARSPWRWMDQVRANAQQAAASVYEACVARRSAVGFRGQRLAGKAEQADSTPLEDGLTISARSAAPTGAQG